MLWAVSDHFQGGSLCLTSSVCWFFIIYLFIYCFLFVCLFAGFLGLLVQSHCGEGGMLQTNSTVMCTQCLSPA